MLEDLTVTPHLGAPIDPPTPAVPPEPPPPAEPPPSPPADDSYDNPLMSRIASLLLHQDRPLSPNTPFEFPYYTPSALRATTADIPDTTQDIFTPSASVIRVVVTPRVFGIKDDSRSSVQVKDWSLMDAGANICLTGDIRLLANAIDIPPLPITVALNGNGSSVDDCCTMRSFIPLALSDGTIHWQLCYYSANAVETIISPQAILSSSDLFASWTMMGYKDNRPGAIRFDSHDGFITMVINLVCRDGLYYCPTDVFTLGHRPTLPECATLPTFPVPKVNRVVNPPPPPVLQRSSHFAPTSKAQQLESAVWLLRLGSPGVTQLDVLPQNATGLPATFDYHPFRFVDFKEQARIRKKDPTLGYSDSRTSPAILHGLWLHACLHLGLLTTGQIKRSGCVLLRRFLFLPSDCR